MTATIIPFRPRKPEPPRISSYTASVLRLADTLLSMKVPGSADHTEVLAIRTALRRKAGLEEQS